jgi:hypothetical protein
MLRGPNSDVVNLTIANSDGTPQAAPAPTLGKVTNLVATYNIAQHGVSIAWDAVTDAVTYVLEFSEDGLNAFQTIGTFTTTTYSTRIATTGCPFTFGKRYQIQCHAEPS